MKTSSRSAFTLIEMLVVIAIIALLASLVVGGVSRTLQRSYGVKTLSNLRQLHLANTLHSLDYRGYYVPHRLYAAQDSQTPDTYWLDNDQFSVYLDGEGHNGWDDWPSTFKAGSPHANRNQGGIAKMSLAISLGGWTQHWMEGAFSSTQLTPYPRMIMFAESAQWLIHGGRVDQSLKTYDDNKGAPFGTIAFRNNGRAGVVRVGGDASMVRYEDILPRSAHPDLWPNVRPQTFSQYP